MNSPWTVISTGNGLSAAWKCEECGRIVFHSGEPSAYAHLDSCSHNVHRTDESSRSGT